MAGCQVGRSPSMLAAYNCVLIIAGNTNKAKKKKRTKNIPCNSVISVQL